MQQLILEREEGVFHRLVNDYLAEGWQIVPGSLHITAVAEDNILYGYSSNNPTTQAIYFATILEIDDDKIPSIDDVVIGDPRLPSVSPSSP